MRTYLEETRGLWDSAEEFRKHVATYTPATHKILLIDDAVAGVMAVEEFPTYLWLVKFYLKVECRGRGIGSKLLADLLANASAQGKTVTLQVLKVNNRAQALYARHGFEVTNDWADLLFMAHSARPVVTQPGAIHPAAIG